MKKIALALLVAAMVCNAVFAGGVKEAGGAKKDVTLSVLWFNDGDESTVFQETMKDYLAANPNVKLDLQIVAYNDFDSKLKMLITAGTPPDIARVSTTTVAAMLDTFLPLDSYVSDMSGLKKMYMPSLLAYAGNTKGELIALPIEATANGMLVNKTAFKNAGIDVDKVSKDWTWETWKSTIQKVIAANPDMKYGLALDFTPHRFSTLLYQFNGHFLNSTQTGMEFNNPGTIKTLNFLKQLHDEGIMPKSVWLGSENPAELFQAGVVACHIGGSWNLNAYNKNVKGFEWGAVQMPKGDIRSSVPGGKFVASFKNCAHPKEAVELMKAFADKAHNEAYAKGTFNISSRTDAAVNYPSNTADFAVFSEELKVTPDVTANEWKNPKFSKVTSYIKEQIVQVLLGAETPEQAVANVDKQGTQFFK